MKSSTKKYDHVTPVLAEPKVATSKNQFILQRSHYGIQVKDGHGPRIFR